MNAEELEVAPGFEHENLQGRVWEPSTEEELREGSGKGFRLSRRRHDHAQGWSTVEGYIFDRRVARR